MGGVSTQTLDLQKSRTGRHDARCLFICDSKHQSNPLSLPLDMRMGREPLMQHLMQDDTDAPIVRSLANPELAIRARVVQDLRGHVANGADREVLRYMCGGVFQLAGHPEITQLQDVLLVLEQDRCIRAALRLTTRIPLSKEDKILRLQIAVHDAMVMYCLHSSEYLSPPEKNLHSPQSFLEPRGA